MATTLKILIIDDDVIDSMTITRSITKAGILSEIDCAFSAREGIKKVGNCHYDLIFLDYMMPDSDGISFLRSLRTLAIDTPVIFVTSQGDENIASQAILAGASDYMPKTLINSDGVAHSIRNSIKLYQIQKLKEETELALKINSNRLSEAQKLAKIGTWEMNLLDDNVYFSEEFYNILELDRNEIPSLELLKSSLTSPEDIQLFESKLKEAQLNVVDVSFSHYLMGKKGTVKYVNVFIKCLNNENDKPFRILGTFQDVSDQKRIEQELVNAKNLAEQSVKIKEQFLTNMSHEIRTPMNGIIGFANILESTNLDVNQKQSIEAIKTAGENLMVIINDILDFAKIEADKILFETINFSLSKIVNSVIELLSPIANSKDINLICSINPEINDQLIGDPTRLSQILINLVGNALKFTEKGYVKLNVYQKEDSFSDCTVQFDIIDTGIGIPEDKVDSVFESFNQASNETTRKFGGTGLGLSISRKLVELQGGKIALKSEVSKGSKFTFFIEYKKVIQVFEHSIIEQTKKIDFNFLQDKKILLVEDNKINQLLTKKVFKGWNKEIDIAENGLIAIEKLANTDYDLILMDIQMPEMDGKETTKYIRSLKGHKSKLPIIALTAHANIDEKQKCLDSGMNDYLTKPFDFNVLLEKIHFNLMIAVGVKSFVSDEEF